MKISIVGALWGTKRNYPRVSVFFIPDTMGKVHGGLARAGKVKRQTPKVEKQQKTKSVVGRAKKRVQFNRRFVNVVSGPGKRGPNSNAAKA